MQIPDIVTLLLPTLRYSVCMCACDTTRQAYLPDNALSKRRRKFLHITNYSSFFFMFNANGNAVKIEETL